MWDRLRRALQAETSPTTASQYWRTFIELCAALEIPAGTDEGAEMVRNLTTSDAHDYVNWAKGRPAQGGRSSMVSKTVSLATVKKKLAALASIWNTLQVLGEASSNPFAPLRSQYKRHDSGDRRPTEMIPAEKVKELLALRPYSEQDARDLCLMGLLFGGALRRGEAVNIRIFDVVRRDGHLYVHLRHTKAQTAAEQLILHWAVEPIERFLEIRKRHGAKPNDGLLVAYRGKAVSSSTEPISEEAAYLIFRKWMAVVGLDERYTPHAARATAITLILEAGKDHRTTAKFSRHKSIEMVVHYDKLRDKRDPTAFDDVDL